MRRKARDCLVSMKCMYRFRSPPSLIGSVSNRGQGGGGSSSSHHAAMLVRRSNSSAILPLRKHLIEKTLQDRTLDDIATGGFYFSSSSLASGRFFFIKKTP